MKTNKEIIKEFIEKGADLEHDRWARWQKYLHSRLQKDNKGFYWLDDGLFEHWERQIDTPYSELSEKEKESDRKETRNYVPLLEKALSDQRKEIIEKIIIRLQKNCLEYDGNWNMHDKKGKDFYCQKFTMRDLIKIIKE